jgi:kumamolisin
MSEGGGRPEGREGRDRTVAIPGSGRTPLAGARRTSDAPDDARLRVTVVVRRKAGAEVGLPPSPPAATDPASSRAELRRRLADEAGADQADVDAVVHYATAAGLRVLETDLATRRVALEATVAQASAAFGVSLGTYEAAGVTYRGREGDVHLPADLAPIVEAVLGLDNRPQARVHLKLGPPLSGEDLPNPDAPVADRLPGVGTELEARAVRAPKPAPLWATQVAQLYAFPAGVDGAGETIGIIELGGGYTDAQLQTYFTKAQVKAPTVVSVPVGVGSNQPGKDPDADGEVLLDIEVAGAIAPGARIVVYFSDPSDRGFLDALSAAVQDTAHSPSVLSISWGSSEDGWTPQARRVLDAALADAARVGMTVLAAAGDHGAGDAVGDGRVHTDFPASSPNVVGCGGTTVVGLNGRMVTEVVWNDGDGWATGGGISDVFAVPLWQTAHMPSNLDTGKQGRGVPDVAGNADITSGYIVFIGEQWKPAGGTSAVAPLYAGLTALVNQALGAPIGALAPLLYRAAQASGSGAFRDVTTGHTTVPQSEFGPATKGYSARRGWDPCTGLGSINGAGLLAQLKQAVQPRPGGGSQART